MTYCMTFITPTTGYLIINTIYLPQILDRDLDHPKGLAVDWVGNNIYFSHGNRIEVATCDGQHRKVLRNDIKNVGPIAIDLTTG